MSLLVLKTGSGGNGKTRFSTVFVVNIYWRRGNVQEGSVMEAVASVTTYLFHYYGCEPVGVYCCVCYN